MLPHLKFEEFLAKYFARKKFSEIQREFPRSRGNVDFRFFDSNEGKYINVEAKAYRSQHVSTATIIFAIRQLLARMSNADGEGARLLVTAEVGDLQRAAIRAESHCGIVDCSDLVRDLKHYPDLAAEFEELLRELRGGEEFSSSAVTVEENLKVYPSEDSLGFIVGESPLIPRPEDSLCVRLQACPPGKADAKKFEDLCCEAVELLFGDDLGKLCKQSSTHTGLRRFDLIARNNMKNDFWRSLRKEFRSIYIVFEFKNYAEPISQREIYTTEKYLYPAAMRSTAIVIARSGMKESAREAVRGALREHGKLIVDLDLSELCKMLNNLVNGDDPNEILAAKLDGLLMTLDR